MSKVRNRSTIEGRELGRMMAQWCDEAEPKARLKVPDLAPRCASCAFRHGPHAANGSPTTQMDALKCVMENIFFACHEPAREGQMCSGFAMMKLSEKTIRARGTPWPFSDEIEKDDPA